MFQDWVKEEIMKGEDSHWQSEGHLYRSRNTSCTHTAEKSVSFFDGTALPSGGRATNLYPAACFKPLENLKQMQEQ